MEKRGTFSRTKAQIADDLLFITPLFLKGHGLRDIAKRLGEVRDYQLSHTTIYQDMKKIVKQWEGERTGLMDRQKIIEIAKINHLEQKYWELFEESRTAKKRRKTKRGGKMIGGKMENPDYIELQTEEQETIGNIQLLQRIEWCIKERATIMGLYKNVGIEAPVANSTARDVIFETVIRRPTNDHIQEAIVLPDEPGVIATKHLQV